MTIPLRFNGLKKKLQGKHKNHYNITEVFFLFVIYIYFFLIVADFYLLSLGEKIQIIKSNVHKTDLTSNEIIIFLAVCLDIKFAILSSNASEYSFTFIDC